MLSERFRYPTIRTIIAPSKMGGKISGTPPFLGIWMNF